MTEPWRSFRLEHLIGGLGVVIAAMVFFGIRYTEDVAARSDFETALGEGANRVERAVDQLRYVLKSVQEAEDMGALNRSNFHRLARRAEQANPSFVGITYVPVVRADQRSEIEQAARRDGFDDFVIHDDVGRVPDGRTVMRPELFVEPAPDESRFGLDWSGDDAFVRATASSVDSGEITSLPSRPDRPATLLGPVFERHGPTFCVSGRRATEKGHALLDYDPAVLLDLVQTEAAMPMHARIVDAAGASVAAASDHVFGASPLGIPLDVPGRSWTLQGEPTRAHLGAHRTWAPYGAALLALLVSSVVVFAARQQRVQKQLVEREVTKRTAELDAQTQGMRRVFHHVDSGLVTIDHHGRIHGETSAAVERWLGPLGGESSFVEYLAGVQPTVADYLDIGLEQLREDLLPRALTLGQMPKRVQRQGRSRRLAERAAESPTAAKRGRVTRPSHETAQGLRSYDLRYLPFVDPDGGDRLLVVISDVTAQLEATSRQAAQATLLAIFERMTNDRDEFLDFFNQSTTLVQRLVEDEEHADLTQFRRDLHTLKGNCGFFALDDISALCHTIEDRLEIDGGLPTSEEIGAIADSWAGVRRNLERFLGTGDPNRIDVTSAEYRTALEALVQENPTSRARYLLETWQGERVGRQFDRIARRTQALAERFGKAPVEVTCTGGSLRLPSEPLRDFWSSVVHVVRNVVDHGFEAPADRASSGKGSARLNLAATVDPGSGDVEISIRDDGRGIDFSKLEAKAKARGISYTRPSELLFVDGLSSRDEVSVTSGRGVGMAAVRAAVESIGGDIAVETSPGHGTTFHFRFPALVPTRPGVLVEA